MKKNMLYGALIGALLIASCSKLEEDTNPTKQTRGVSSSEYVIDISTSRSAGNILNHGKSENINRTPRKMDTTTLGAMPIHPRINVNDPFTEIHDVESFESVVLPELQPHIWIGNIMTKGSIINCVYKPLIYPRTPITVSLTLPGTSPKEITLPSYSKYLSYIQEQTANGTFLQNGEFNFTTEQFTSYNELKVAFGSNVNTNGLFWGSSTGSSSTDHLINKATGLYVKFYQTSFKVIMDYPDEQIATVPDNMLDSAVYINSITYGRLGILTLETNESVYEAQDKINKIFKTLFYSSSSTFTKEEQSFLNGCEFKIYLIGGNGSTSVESFNGLDGFIQHIKKGSFSKDVPGTPIFCTFNHVKDNSPVAVNFKFSVKKEPLYVELIHKPSEMPKDFFDLGIRGTQYDKAKGYGELSIKFYKNRAKIPTIADPRIPIIVKEEAITTRFYQDHNEASNTTKTTEMKNAGYQTSIPVTWEYKTWGTPPGGIGPQWIYHYDTFIFMYKYKAKSGSGNRFNPGVEINSKYSIEQTEDYVVLGNPLDSYNCPLGRLN